MAISQSSINPAAASNQSKLQWFNITNLLAYVANASVTFGVGLTGILGPTDAEVSVKYQTLVTPAGYAFSIWGVIFVAELLWAIVQTLPSFRSQPLVVHGVGFSYVIVSLAQIAWTLLFTLEYVTASLVAMTFILIPLMSIITSTSRLPHDSMPQYFLLKFPFEVHGGWIMAASVVNANAVLVANGYSANSLAHAAWISLGLLTLFAIYYNRTYVVPIVLAWASFAIAVELKHPMDSITENFSSSSIHWLMRISESLAVSILVTVAIQIIVSRTRGRKSGSAMNPTVTTPAKPTSFKSSSRP